MFSDGIEKEHQFEMGKGIDVKNGIFLNLKVDLYSKHIFKK